MDNSKDLVPYKGEVPPEGVSLKNIFFLHTFIATVVVFILVETAVVLVLQK